MNDFYRIIKFCLILTCLADLFFPCHTRSEVSIKSKCEFSALRYILNSMDFSLVLLAQNDKINLVILTCLIVWMQFVILNFTEQSEVSMKFKVCLKIFGF